MGSLNPAIFSTLDTLIAVSKSIGSVGSKPVPAATASNSCNGSGGINGGLSFALSGICAERTTAQKPGWKKTISPSIIYSWHRTILFYVKSGVFGTS
jgi:hypothetical protein